MLQNLRVSRTIVALIAAAATGLPRHRLRFQFRNATVCESLSRVGWFMDVVSVGRRLRCPESQPDSDGTIVRADRQRTLTGEHVTYLILWDNGQATRSVSLMELKRPEWVALPETRSIEHCNQLWFEHLMETARARGSRQHAASAAAEPIAARSAAPAPLASLNLARLAYARAYASHRLPLEAAIKVDTPAAIARQAREMLASLGIEDVAMHAARRVKGTVLQVAWMDGPATTGMYTALSQLKTAGLVARIDLARSASPLMLQAAIEYIQHELYPASDLLDPTGELRRVLKVVTPHAYQHGALASTFPPNGHAHSSLNYGQMIRCVLERWDGRLHRFCDTHASRYMIGELAAIFSRGDAEAAVRMDSMLRRLEMVQEQAEQMLDSAPTETPAATERA